MHCSAQCCVTGPTVLPSFSSHSPSPSRPSSRPSAPQPRMPPCHRSATASDSAASVSPPHAPLQLDPAHAASAQPGHVVQAVTMMAPARLLRSPAATLKAGGASCPRRIDVLELVLPPLLTPAPRLAPLGAPSATKRPLSLPLGVEQAPKRSSCWVRLRQRGGMSQHGGCSSHRSRKVRHQPGHPSPPSSRARVQCRCVWQGGRSCSAPAWVFGNGLCTAVRKVCAHRRAADCRPRRGGVAAVCARCGGATFGCHTATTAGGRSSALLPHGSSCLQPQSKRSVANTNPCSKTSHSHANNYTHAWCGCCCC